MYFLICYKYLNTCTYCVLKKFIYLSIDLYKLVWKNWKTQTPEYNVLSAYHKIKRTKWTDEPNNRLPTVTTRVENHIKKPVWPERDKIGSTILGILRHYDTFDEPILLANSATWMRTKLNNEWTKMNDSHDPD